MAEANVESGVLKLSIAQWPESGRMTPTSLVLRVLTHNALEYPRPTTHLMRYKASKHASSRTNVCTPFVAPSRRDYCHTGWLCVIDVSTTIKKGRHHQADASS